MTLKTHLKDQHEIVMRRYQQIRMAVFSPEYLINNTKLNEEDFTAMIDEIVRLQALREENARLKEELRCVSLNRDSWREQSREHNNSRIELTDILRDKEAEITRLREALRWALGEEGEFPERQPGEGAYWWRKELRTRAALAPQGQEGSK